MCHNATATAATLLKAIEPTIVSLLTLEGLNNTPEGIAAINAYNAALTAVENWVPGTSAQVALELITAFQNVFNTLPLPTTVTVLANLILAGIETVIGVLTANSPAPPTTEATTPEVTAAAQTFHAHAVAAETESKVVAMTGIKVSTFDKARAALGDTHVAANRYKSEWNKAVDANSLPVTLKVA